MQCVNCGHCLWPMRFRIRENWFRLWAIPWAFWGWWLSRRRRFMNGWRFVAMISARPNELAALSLIRPSATCGHLGDVVGDKLIYDAPTAHGGSGGPVFNSRGEVIGVNAAYLDGFSGGTLGVSVRALRPLIAAAQKK